MRAGGFNKRIWRRRSSVHDVRARLILTASSRGFSRECRPREINAVRLPASSSIAERAQRSANYSLPQLLFIANVKRVMAAIFRRMR